MARMTEGSLPQSPQSFSTNYLGDFRISHLDPALLEDHLRVKYYGAVEDVSMRI